MKNINKVFTLALTIAFAVTSTVPVLSISTESSTPINNFSTSSDWLTGSDRRSYQLYMGHTGVNTSLQQVGAAITGGVAGVISAATTTILCATLSITLETVTSYLPDVHGNIVCVRCYNPWDG